MLRPPQTNSPLPGAGFHYSFAIRSIFALYSLCIRSRSCNKVYNFVYGENRGHFYERVKLMSNSKAPRKTNDNYNPERVEKSYDPSNGEYKPKVPSPPPCDDEL
jgi:hypothetical protein